MKGGTSVIRIKLNDAHAEVFDVITNFSFYREHLDQVMEKLAPERGKLYLDLGCGTGNMLGLAKDRGISFIGIDFSLGMLKKAKEKSNGLVLADLHNLPIRDSCVDGATNVNVLYQLERPDAFFKEVYRVLKPGGMVVISTPKRKRSSSKFDPEVIKTIIKNPKLLTNIRKVLRYSKINKKIVHLNPNAFYEKEELEKMLGDFEILGIKEVYKGQNWLISARKPPKVTRADA